jgi:hypothetical protein
MRGIRGVQGVSVLCGLLLCAALSLKKLHAEDGSSERSAIKLSVRAIQASDSGSPSERANQDPSASKKIHVESQLSDIEEKLTQLPFSHFHLISREEKTLQTRNRESIALPRGQVLTVRPLHMDADPKKICLYLNWQDQDGSHILDTRVHFDTRDSVITGTDSSHNEGLILAIRAEHLP